MRSKHRSNVLYCLLFTSFIIWYNQLIIDKFCIRLILLEIECVLTIEAAINSTRCSNIENSFVRACMLFSQCEFILF